MGVGNAVHHLLFKLNIITSTIFLKSKLMTTVKRIADFGHLSPPPKKVE
jgi:hypothetical protein